MHPVSAHADPWGVNKKVLSSEFGVRLSAAGKEFGVLVRKFLASISEIMEEMNG